jgi:hypothetical protein
VLAILMPLEPECDLRLALSAKANDLVQVLIRLRLRSICIGARALDHLGTLLQNSARFNLIHQDAFAFKSVTDWTSHIAFNCLLFDAAVKGQHRRSGNKIFRAV